MGCSWSVFLCQCAGEALFKRATRLERCPLVNDRDQAPIFHESPGQECDDKFGYLCVDNIGVLGTSPARATDVIGKGTTAFDNAGLLTDEVSVSGSPVISLRTVLDCERRRSSLAPRPFWRLRRGTDAILSAKTVTGSTLEVVIGHATFCSLLARSSMTCFHSMYKYIQRLGPSRGILWDTVPEELSASRRRALKVQT